MEETLQTNENEKKRFISGVVEGFYGKPWTLSQREDLFSKINKWKMNTYVYAPKDDKKHRKCWRDKYMFLEKETLKRLIKSSQENNVEFIYAISPGIDIVFSSPKDIKHLKEKLRQVYKLGCRSFALLFDDIDPELCLVDKTEFSSSAHAQASITNTIHDEFKNLNLLLFCPTEYCARRAKPNIVSSEYLKVIGKTLHANIHILWTGPKVVSNEITSDQLKELAAVLKRKPLIWENLHANDYDHRRVFFGPFKGRPLDIYENITGILTNPNCEYECNFIAIHALGDWVRNAEVNFNKLHKELYDANSGLSKAINDWYAEMNIAQDIIKKASHLITDYGIDWDLNSLIDNEVLRELLSNDDNEDDMSESENEESTPKQDSLQHSPVKENEEDNLCLEDLNLLCDLFYLPYKHGPMAKTIVREFRWLKENALHHEKEPSQNEIDIWCSRSEKFSELCKNVETMYERLILIPNRRILKEIHPYIYDVKEVVYRAKSYVKYLGSKECKNGGSFLPDDPEAYSYKGGLLNSLEKEMPSLDDIDGGLFVDDNNLFVIRPYIASTDKSSVASLCWQSVYKFTISEKFPDFQFDKMLGGYMKYSPDLVYVLMVKNTILGIIAAHRNVKGYQEKLKNEWLPTLLKKYPVDNKNLTKEEIDVLASLSHPPIQSDKSFEKHRALFTFILHKSIKSPTAFRSMLNVVSSSVQCSMYTHLSSNDVIKYKTLLEQVNMKQIKDDDCTSDAGFYYYD